MSNDDLNKTETAVLNRFNNTIEQAKLLCRFFGMGFRNIAAFKAIVLHYDSSLTDKEIKYFWEIKLVNEDVIRKVEMVIDKLKTE